MTRTGPNLHSRHEFASRSVVRRIPSQTSSHRNTSTDTTRPATTSATECIPVSTHDAATATAHSVQNARIFGQRRAKVDAARNAHTTWYEGSAPAGESAARSNSSARPNRDVDAKARGGTTNGKKRNIGMISASDTHARST